MKKPGIRSKRLPEKKINIVQLSPEELKIWEASVKFLEEQADRLGLLDPLDTEPAMIFLAQGKTE
jgi:hypothetical protein